MRLRLAPTRETTRSFVLASVCGLWVRVWGRYLACTLAGSFTRSGTVRHTCACGVNPGVCVGSADGVARDLGAFSVWFIYLLQHALG